MNEQTRGRRRFAAFGQTPMPPAMMALPNRMPGIGPGSMINAGAGRGPQASH